MIGTAVNVIVAERSGMNGNLYLLTKHQQGKFYGMVLSINRQRRLIVVASVIKQKQKPTENRNQRTTRFHASLYARRKFCGNLEVYRPDPS